MTRQFARAVLSAAVVLAVLDASSRPPASARAAAQRSATPTLNLPRPTGPHTVGTTTFRLIDEARTDAFGTPAEKRQVVVHVWYPAISGSTGERAPYLREGPAEARTFARLLRQPEGALDYLVDTPTHALLDVPPRSDDPLPVLLFSHGYTAIASSYTALLEDLASHGFAVLSVVHPYESMAARLADDRVVTMLDADGQMRSGIRAVLGEWGKEDDTMAAVTRTTDPDEALSLMRAYLQGLPLTTAALDRWVADMLLVVDRLPALPKGPAARVAARMATARLGAFGHSMGGVAAADVCARDRRCRAALNLDGIPQYGSLIESTSDRPFLMVYSGRTGRLGASDVIYRRAMRSYRRVDVADTLHNDFSDMILWGGPLAGRPMFGKRAAADAVAVTRQIVREFFDQELRGRPSPLLTGRSSLSGVRVH